jgi:hypothetical protein
VASDGFKVYESDEIDVGDERTLAKEAKPVRSWPAKLFNYGGREATGQEKVVIKYTVGDETFYVGTTLEEVYTRGFIGGSSGLSEFLRASRVENLDILPATAQNTKKTEASAETLRQDAKRYSDLTNLNETDYLKQIKNTYKKKDLGSTLTLISDTINLHLNPSAFLTQEEAEAMGLTFEPPTVNELLAAPGGLKLTSDELKSIDDFARKRGHTLIDTLRIRGHLHGDLLEKGVGSHQKGRRGMIWTCLQAAIKDHLGKYNASGNLDEYHGWKPGFLVESTMVLRYSPRNRPKTKFNPEGESVLASGPRCKSYFWERKMGESRPVFYNSWSVDNDLDNNVQTETLDEVKIRDWPELRDPKKIIKVSYTVPMCTCGHPKYEHLLDRTPMLGQSCQAQLGIMNCASCGEKFSETKDNNCPKCGSKSINYASWGETGAKSATPQLAHRGPTAQLGDELVEYGICECPNYDHDQNLQKEDELMTVKDYYEKDIENRFRNVSIDSQGAHEAAEASDALFIPYSDPKHDDDVSGVECSYCSKGDAIVYHARLEKTMVDGNPSYPRTSEWDTTLESRGFAPDQLVILKPDMSDADYELGTEDKIVLRRHEIAERNLMDVLDPAPALYPAAPAKDYKLRSNLIKQIKDFEERKAYVEPGYDLELDKLKAQLQDINKTIKDAERAVFALRPKIVNGKISSNAWEVVTLSTKKEGASRSSQWSVEARKQDEAKKELQIIKQSGSAPSDDDLLRLVALSKTLVPTSESDSVDTNGAISGATTRFLNPPYPGSGFEEGGVPQPRAKELAQHLEAGLSADIDEWIDSVKSGKPRKPNNPALLDPLSQHEAPWISFDRDHPKDQAYLVLPPTNDLFEAEFAGAAKPVERGETFEGSICDHCHKETGHLPLYPKTNNGVKTYWVKMPYVAYGEDGEAYLKEWDVPILEAVSQAREMWVSHRWTAETADGVNGEPRRVDDSIDGFKTYQNADGGSRIPVFSAVFRNREMAPEGGITGGTCHNTIFRNGVKEICGNTPAFIESDPKTLVRVQNDKTGLNTWQTVLPGLAKAKRELEEATQEQDDEKIQAAKDKMDHAEQIQSGFRASEHGGRRFCQACFIANFDLFPDNIIQEMNLDLEDILTEARSVWVYATEHMEDGSMGYKKRELSDMLCEFAIKWFSTESFWDEWERYIKEDVKIRGTSREGVALPDYLSKNLLRARYRACILLEDIALNGKDHIHMIDRDNSEGISDRDRKKRYVPSYIDKLERLQAIVSSWGLWNNAFKRKGYERVMYDRTNEGTFHIVPLWKTMTRAERNRSAYDPGRDPIPHTVRQRGALTGSIGDSLDRTKSFVIIEGIKGDESYLNGLSGYVESTDGKTIIVKLTKNDIIENRYIRLHKGEYAEFPPDLPRVTFEDKHKKLISEEKLKRLEERDVIRLIGKFTSDSLYW